MEMFAIAKMKSDEVIQQANQQAEEIVKSAKEKGDAMISGVSQELENLKAETEKMKNQYHIFCIKFEAMLQNQLKLLKREDVEGELEEISRQRLLFSRRMRLRTNKRQRKNNADDYHCSSWLSGGPGGQNTHAAVCKACWNNFCN